jgi:hypothetical protein
VAFWQAMAAGNDAEAERIAAEAGAVAGLVKADAASSKPVIRKD